MDQAPVVIIGSGLAGYTVARELRRLDGTVGIQIFTSDDGGFYSKPMLSNGFSANKTAASLLVQSVAKMAEQLRATIHTDCSVDAIDCAARTVTVNGRKIPYGKLVLALGADPIRVPIKGSGANEVVSVNNLTDYQHLLQRLSGKKRIAILGAGLIGCEFANDLCSTGYEINLIDPGSWPLGRLLPSEIGTRMSDAFTAAGIKLHTNTVCESIEQTDAGFQISLQNGATFAADVVISAIGLRPRSTLAATAGITVNRGIVVDRHLQTNKPDVYALGDCAEVCGLLLPYVMPIMQCARALAKTLAGQLTPVNYAAMPIVVKTPIFPLAISPPLSPEGKWEFHQLDNSGAKAIFLGDQNRPTGFVVSGDKVDERRKLEKELSPWLTPM